jgi:Fur family ferric uptake transcriptional regulator
MTVEELHRIVREKHPNIGFVTVYRTLKLLVEAQLCDEIYFDDGIARYEHKYNHKHHDHLMCTQCGEVVEVIEPEIEKLQDKLFKKYGFVPQAHRLELYGICPKCGSKQR